MRMLNRAIEDAAEFNEFMRQMTKPALPQLVMSDYRPGENRAERRARQRAEKKAEQRAKRVAA